MHVDTDSHKLKAGQKFFGWAESNKGDWTQKLTVFQKWTCGMNWFLCAGTNLEKIKVDSIIFGWAWSIMAMTFKTLKSALS